MPDSQTQASDNLPGFAFDTMRELGRQVSTATGSVSHYYNLGIIVPRAYILGADEYYAMAGGDISLVCIIEDVSAWYSAFKLQRHWECVSCVSRGTVLRPGGQERESCRT